MSLWAIPLVITIIAFTFVYYFEKETSTRLHVNPVRESDVPSAIARILSMGPQCAQAVGVYNVRKQKKQLHDLAKKGN
jgi:hypothetical protein